MFRRTIFLLFTLAAVFVFHGWPDRFSFSFLKAEDLKSGGSRLLEPPILDLDLRHP